MTPHRLLQRARGAAAIELALLLPIVVITLAPLILCARFMWHYTVAHKAAQDAARYMSTISRVEMDNPVLAAEAERIAVAIARAEVAELAPGYRIAAAVVHCNNLPCASAKAEPTTQIRVYLGFYLIDTIMGTYLGPRGMLIAADVTVPYAGR